MRKLPERHPAASAVMLMMGHHAIPETRLSNEGRALAWCRQRPSRPSPPNKSTTDPTAGGSVPHVGGGIVGRVGAAGSCGRMPPSDESG